MIHQCMTISLLQRQEPKQVPTLFFDSLEEHPRALPIHALSHEEETNHHNMFQRTEVSELSLIADTRRE